MTICPDNSTEYLLRAILESTCKFNWDPLNFAFTAAIGFLALLIAIITVFQGLLAAGPGRLKGSKNAIGPWSKKTKSRFDRNELGLRTTAYVPRLRWELFEPLSFDPNARIKFFANNVGAQNQLDGGTTVAASWLQLLKQLNLADPNVEIKYRDSEECSPLFDFIPRATDYLPNDILAAPAAAEMRCLILLAVLANENASIEKLGNSRYLTVVGDNSQLSFREHPILGTVAACESYKTYDGDSFNHFRRHDWSSSFSARLASRLRFASGVLDYKGQRACDPQMSHDDLVLAFYPFIDDLKARCKDCTHSICAGSQEPSRRNVALVLLVNASPLDHECKAFPYVALGIDVSVDKLFRGARFGIDTAESWKILVRVFEHLTQRVNTRSPSTLALVSPSEWSWLQLRPRCYSHSGLVFVDKLSGTFIRCIKWTSKRQEGYSGLSLPYIEGTTSLPGDIETIDDFFFLCGGAEIGCAMNCFIADLARVRQGAHENRHAFEEESNKRWLEVFPNPNIAAGVRYLLAWRGIALAAYLSTATDTSPVFEDDFKDYTVKVI